MLFAGQYINTAKSTLMQRLPQKGAQFELTIQPYAKPQSRGALPLGQLQLRTLAIGSWQEYGFAPLVGSLAHRRRRSA